MRYRLYLLILLFITALSRDVGSEEMSFSVPVDCIVGENCFIQNYFDHDPGPGRKDYACGRLTYDGHKGTDFRLQNEVRMYEGTAVLAAGPGLVIRARDGMPDQNVNEIGPDLIKGREAGNGVVIDHGHGWMTQYSHLKQGSVLVKPGQYVKQGDKIGLIGLSGNTEFPHVEFTVRYNGQELDPFVGKRKFHDCSSVSDSLWSAMALQKMPYQETGLLCAGFSGEPPQAKRARQGDYASNKWGVLSEALIFWVDLFGILAGDTQEFVIYGPDGNPLTKNDQLLQESNVSWFAFAGVRRPKSGWPEGRYTGVYILKRQGETKIKVSRTITLSGGDERKQ